MSVSTGKRQGISIENGATQVVVGSHRWNRGPTDADAGVAMVSLQAPAGSIFAFESRVWHRAGANSSKDQTRAAIFPFYSTPIYRTQENWFLSLRPDVVDAASDTLLTLLAYKSEGFGLVYGRSPLEHLARAAGPGVKRASIFQVLEDAPRSG